MLIIYKINNSIIINCIYTQNLQYLGDVMSETAFTQFTNNPNKFEINEFINFVKVYLKTFFFLVLYTLRSFCNNLKRND